MRPAICELAGETARPLLERLDPARRAQVLMALMALVLAGLALVALIMLGARYVRRLARRGLRPSKAEPDDWAVHPLAPDERDETAENSR